MAKFNGLVLYGDDLFTKTQQRVLSLLYGRPEQTFYLNQIVRLAAVGKGSVSRELEKLCAAGLLTVSRQGNQNHYQANANNPIFNELKAITQKTFGVVDIIKEVLVSLLPKLSRAFIYGSVAQGTKHAGSDIDLMLVGDDMSYSEVMELLAPAEKQLGRTINPTLYTVAEFTDRKTNHQPFIQRVMEQPKLWLVGDMELKN
ncbi:MAG: nucleotidyltransferase domain-containing protein [Methylococcales bacterium]|nr:nucleotidyltransferase domain-containing protein [Methylococcales bacterium]